MTEQDIDKIVNNFLLSFNEMCVRERRDFLERSRTINYEHGSRIKKYQVSYEIKKSQGKWLIQAVSNGFWIFKRKFPLLRITRLKDKINFSGMFTYTIQNFDINELEEKLNQYLIICKNEPKDVFTKS